MLKECTIDIADAKEYYPLPRLSKENIRVSNPALTKFLADSEQGFDNLYKITQDYSWAIPDYIALSIIANYSPIIEVGAGNGYWAYLLRQLGCDITAYDIASAESGENTYFSGKQNSWTEVQIEQPERIKEILRSTERTLFLCWPPYNEPMASDYLKNYNGEYIIYIGEGIYGCTANDSFHETLDKEWSEVERYYHPIWKGHNDCLTVYRRKDITEADSPISQYNLYG